MKMTPDKEQLKRHIHKSDLTALEKRYLEGLVDAQYKDDGQRLINADELKADVGIAINGMIEGDETEEELKLLGLIKATLDATIDVTPAVEAEPVRHGRWISWEKSDNFIPSHNRHECSECHDAARVLVNGFELLSDYCPNCGAKMDGKEE